MLFENRLYKNDISYATIRYINITNIAE